MVKETKAELLSAIVSRLAEAFKPEEIYLFGSRARGTEKLGSDFDLLVILSAMDEPGYRYSQKAHQLLWGLRKSADIFFMTREQFEGSKKVIGTLPEVVGREGKSLYAA